MKKFVFILLLIPLLFACEKEEILYPKDKEMETTPLLLGPVTYSNPEISEMLSSIGLYAYDVNASDIVYDHTEFTYLNELLRPANPNDIEYWKFTETLDVYAYAPYNSLVIQQTTNFNTAVLDISILAEQSSGTNYKNCDLLYGSQAGVTYANWNGGSKNITFSHRLSKIDVNLKGDGILSNTEINNVSVKIVNTYTNANWDLKTDVLAVSNNTTKDITPNLTTTKSGFVKSMQAIILPQTMTASTAILKITRNSQDYFYKLEDNFTFEEGKAYAFDITLTSDNEIIFNVSETAWVNNNRADTNEKIKYKVGDYFPIPDDRSSAVGVVFQVANGGTTGKVVSLDHNYWSTKVRWWEPGSDAWGEAFDNSTNGLVNQNAAKSWAGNKFKEKLPAMWWCYKYGEDIGEPDIWYLPAIYELETLRNNYYNNVNNIKNRVSMYTDDYYYSSTKEKYPLRTKVFYLKFDNVNAVESVTYIAIDRTDYYYIRAIRSFDNR
ncbi:hypothetical protein M2459_003223 [Parabacteroides sp. PF5-5]|uniref:fimbrillin family protein n=1 Tax=unclassified Parabacteroides TaxID=2649774 RepID=UPI002475CA36|nr:MULTISPECIES: fimbrillin family protein [unclassified Parabacteroides]MDH6306521.1 hypothetical protein [Parabacteroides sp. PH5-39]MDH6317488.1 hypothetical protein [Parabacteroides sp. PF5-13]MDH6321209.1 hypothetical protein [Parabacteroides sp. PH5-13]MDH6324941.1 hypothetical protein [Parabacteroides sp. PH5-8]MDH6328650.1 hypothetical protein [Parabacteroides sp. PH5-41]